jgi:hypothetical protein
MKPLTLKHLASRLHEQTMEVAALRAALAIQVDRIIRLEAELDARPYAPGPRQPIRALSAEAASGNGHYRSRG